MLLLLGGLAGGGYFGYQKVKGYFGTKDFAGAGYGDVQVQVVQNDTATDIANTLFKAGVVKSAAAFVSAANSNPKSKTIEVGYYKLKKQMKASLALDALLVRDKDGALANKISTKVTIPEGMITKEIYAKLAEVSKLPVDDFVNAAKDPLALGIPDYWFKREDGKPQQNPPSLEGFLYPATYEFEPGADAKTILTQDGEPVPLGRRRHEVRRHRAVVVQHLAVRGVDRRVDRAGRGDEGGRHARCRPGALQPGLRRQVPVQLPADRQRGQLLAAADRQGCQGLRLVDLQRDPRHVEPLQHPREGRHAAGPISNPGKDALTGAMTAPKSGYLYFLAIDTAGNTAFATTYSEFCQKVKQAKNNGVSISLC